MRIAGRHRRIDADPVDSGIAEIALVQHAGTARKTDDRTTGKTNFQCSNDAPSRLDHPAHESWFGQGSSPAVEQLHDLHASPDLTGQVFDCGIGKQVD